MANANPTLRRQVQVGFSEETVYGERAALNPIIRPVVRSLEITPTQARMNIGRTGSIDASRTFFSTQTYDYSMTVEADPNMAMWFLKWALGKAYSIGTNKYRFVPVPLDDTLDSFTIYADTQQTDFIDTNERTLQFTGAMIESLAFRTAGTEDDKSVTMEISGPLQQPNVSDVYPYSMIGAGLMLPAEHPVIGTENDDIIPYIHQNFGATVTSPTGFRVDLLDATFTINNSLKMNTYPDGDNEPFISEIIYMGRNIQMEWTAEYRDMVEYRTFHEADKIIDLQWFGTHLLQYAADSQYRLDFYMPSVAISDASQIISAGEAEETLEQTYTADLINRAIVERNSSTGAYAGMDFADDEWLIASSFTSKGADANAPKSHLSFVQLDMLSANASVAPNAPLPSFELFVDVYTNLDPSGGGTPTPTDDSDDVPGVRIGRSGAVLTDWISEDQPVSFVFANPPLLEPNTKYWLVMHGNPSIAVAAGQLNITANSSATNLGATSDDNGGSWTLTDIQWIHEIGYNGFPVVLEIETDANFVVST